MRELHAWHSDRRHAPDTPADHPGAHARDTPKHAILSDPAERVARALEYRKTVEAHQAADYAARHAKPQDTRPDHAPDSMDKPSSRIAARDLPEHEEVARKRKPERSWLPSNEASGVVVSIDVLFTAVNASYHVVPGKIDGIAAAALGVVVAGVAWANKRWKEKHADRPEG